MENEKAHRKSGSYVFRKVAIYSSVAAAAVICVTLAFTSVSKKAYNRGLYAHIQEMPVNMTEYSTSNGEIRRVTLPDSSKVILNAGSVLICPERFGAGGREVYLSGEAVFDVTGDTGRAFVVKTSNLNVKVHGTRFNVSAYSDSRLVSATLCRGSISAMNNEGARRSGMWLTAYTILAKRRSRQGSPRSAADTEDPRRQDPDASSWTWINLWPYSLSS